jgi:hypothetical protein
MIRHLKTRCLALPLIVIVAFTVRGDELETLGNWPTNEYQFARLVYTYNPYGDGIGDWTTDYPSAEYFLTKGVSRLSRVDMDEAGRSVEIRLDEDDMFNYPWLYAVEVGNWILNEYEAERLREYLLRGGFLMVDDFHGSIQWRDFMDSMRRVFPDRAVVDIEDANEILHVVYSVDERIQVPGIVSIPGCGFGRGGFGGSRFRGGTGANGIGYERDGATPIWRGIYDDDGRLMVIINHNMDLGDAWEHADDPCYPQEMTTLALNFAVNYVIYAMTH